jgi:hypothetical protein
VTDRFDKQGDDLASAFQTVRCPDRRTLARQIAAALRAAESSALNAVRQYVEAMPECSQRAMLRLLDDLIPPAAAPAKPRDTPCGGCGHPLWWHQWDSKEHAFCCAPLDDLQRDYCRCKNYEKPAAAPAAETCPLYCGATPAAPGSHHMSDCGLYAYPAPAQGEEALLRECAEALGTLDMMFPLESAAHKLIAMVTAKLRALAAPPEGEGK